MGNIILGFLYDQLWNVMLGLILFWILWQFYFCFEDFGWLVWLFKNCWIVCLILIKFFFFLNTTHKENMTIYLGTLHYRQQEKLYTSEMVRQWAMVFLSCLLSKLHNTPKCGVVLNSKHIRHLICTTTS